MKALLMLVGMLAAGKGCLAGMPATELPVAEVRIRAFMFEPMTLTVPAGATVSWLNQDDEPHTVVSAAGLFRSGALDTGMSFTYRFDTPGTYHILCSIHPRMQATVVVR